MFSQSILTYRYRLQNREKRNMDGGWRGFKQKWNERICRLGASPRSPYKAEEHGSMWSSTQPVKNVIS